MGTAGACYRHERIFRSEWIDNVVKGIWSVVSSAFAASRIPCQWRTLFSGLLAANQEAQFNDL